MNVTVCIPTWNGERYLAETMRSVLAQSYQDFECLVVDDGSTDHTLDIVRSFHDSRIRCHINPKQLGIAGNYNRCLELSRGEYICVFQQDDLMKPDNLKQKLAVLVAEPSVSFVHSSAELLTSESEAVSIVELYSTTDQILDGNRQFRELLLSENYICNPTVVARRSRMLEVGGYDLEIDYACDYEIWLKMCINQRVGFVAAPLVTYRWHDTNSSHRFQIDNRMKEMDQARSRALQHYRQTTGREDADILGFAMEKVSKLEHCSVHLDQGRAWLEKQVDNWRNTAEDFARQLQELSKSEQYLSAELQQCRHQLQRIKNTIIWRVASKVRSLLGFRRHAQCG